MAIYFHNENIDFPDLKKEQIKDWLRQVAKIHAKIVGDLNYIFTTDENILSINKEYLNHDYYTDVITFDYTKGKKISGDIYISLETVRTNSDKFKQDYNEELRRVIIHGVLHLIGFKDKTDLEAQEMRRQEENAILVLGNNRRDATSNTPRNI